jgi:hypothetical protein
MNWKHVGFEVFHGGDYEERCLLGCYAASELYRLTTATCRQNLVPTFVDREVSREHTGK